MVGAAAHPHALTRLMEPVATALELFGVFVIVAGILWATGRFLLRGAGHLGVNAFARRHPGNVADLDPDLGAAIRFTLGF